MGLPTNQAKGQGSYKVYSLCEPGTDIVRYIGITGTSLELRLKDHLKKRKKTTYRSNWVSSLRAEGVLPEIDLIEDNLSLEQAKQKEREYIRLFKSFGARLTNLTNGGDGLFGYKWSDAQKRQISENMKGEKGFWFGKTIPAKTKEKISNTLKGRSLSEETKQKMKGRKAWNKGIAKSEDSERKRLESYFRNRNLKILNNASN